MNDAAARVPGDALRDGLPDELALTGELAKVGSALASASARLDAAGAAWRTAAATARTTCAWLLACEVADGRAVDVVSVDSQRSIGTLVLSVRTEKCTSSHQGRLQWDLAAGSVHWEAKELSNDLPAWAREALARVLAYPEMVADLREVERTRALLEIARSATHIEVKCKALRGHEAAALIHGLRGDGHDEVARCLGALWRDGWQGSIDELRAAAWALAGTAQDPGV